MVSQSVSQSVKKCTRNVSVHFLISQSDTSESSPHFPLPFVTSVLISSAHLCSDLTTDVFLSYFATRILMYFLFMLSLEVITRHKSLCIWFAFAEWP